jgi:hypothetical protein
VDPVTPLLEQFSFSGKLDTLFGIGIKNLVEVPEELLQEVELNREGPVKKIPLETDVYRDLVHLSNDGSKNKIHNVLNELHKMEAVSKIKIFFVKFECSTFQMQQSISSVGEMRNHMPVLAKLIATKALASQALSLITVCQCLYAQSEYTDQIRCEIGKYF